MPKKSEKGFAPIIVIILLAIVGASFLVIKNIPINQSQPTPDKGFQASSSGEIKTSPSPSPTPTKGKGTSFTPAPTKKVTPSPTNTPSSSNNNSSSSNTSSNPTSTPTPTPTQAPTATHTPAPTQTPTPSSSPYVRVTYPSGGENFQVGNTVTIRWETNMPMGSCQIQNIDSNNSGPVVGSSVNVTQQSINWVATNGNTTLTEEQYRVYMICYDLNGGTQFATGNYFTVRK